MHEQSSIQPGTANARRLATAWALAALAAGMIIGCTTGTPAAPEGTEIPIAYEYIPGSRDVLLGNFDAIISATVIDQVSDVPQVGVGVYFRVTAGPGQFTEEGPVITNHAGHAESVLIARGATSTNRVSVEVSSGPATAKLDIDVNGGFSATNESPTASFTISPDPPRVNQDVTVNVSASSDPDCPGGDPETWSVAWGDGLSDTGLVFDTTTTKTHRYTAAATVTITVTVEDCTGLEDTASKTVAVAP